jgi:predicted ester cyclase
VADELFSPDLAASARHWGAPFRTSFSDVQMQVVGLVAEGDQVAGRFRCSGTYTGTFSRVHGGRIVEMWGLEDTAERLRQLGLP